MSLPIQSTGLDEQRYAHDFHCCQLLSPPLEQLRINRKTLNHNDIMRLGLGNGFGHRLELATPDITVLVCHASDSECQIRSVQSVEEKLIATLGEYGPVAWSSICAVASS